MVVRKAPSRARRAYKFIDAHRDEFSIQVMCRLLGAARAGYCAWVDARALGAISRGPGTTPTLMGLGNDPDKLVVIADAAAAGTNAVAFWRDAIPEGFEQKPGTKSRRIADPTRIELSRLTIEPQPSMLGYGVTFLNSTYPKPLPAGPGNAFTGGITPPAPLGIEKSTWNPDKGAFEKAWTNKEVDNIDIMVPVVSAATGLLYAAHKEKSSYQYLRPRLEHRRGQGASGVPG